MNETTCNNVIFDINKKNKKKTLSDRDIFAGIIFFFIEDMYYLKDFQFEVWWMVYVYADVSKNMTFIMMTFIMWKSALIYSQCLVLSFMYVCI